MTPRKIERALISVYDKTDIVEFARALVDEFGIEIISTGGTARLLKENGIPVTLVEEITGFPELLDGRVKTLHPKIFAGILADRDNPEHMRQLAEQGIKTIDLVVVNLYPFEKTVADPNCTFEQAMEMIDIGGVSLLRAAAKNFRHVVPIVRAQSMEYLLQELRESPLLVDTARIVLASITYEESSRYDEMIDAYLTHLWTVQRCESVGAGRAHELIAQAPIRPNLLPWLLPLRLSKRFSARYGENPHQHAALYQYAAEYSDWLSSGECTTNEISFNNYLDAEASLNLCVEITRELSKCGTGFQPVSPCGAGVPSARNESSHGGPEAGFLKIDSEQHFRRHLPPIQNPGKTYFITFRLRGKQELSPEERTIVLEACRFWDRRKFDLHACVVMRDHVHLLLTPLEVSKGCRPALGEIVHSIKQHSAQMISRLRKEEGSIWLDEYFDRLMRNEREFTETLNYIADNPVKEKLASSFHEYPWFWDESKRNNAGKPIIDSNALRPLESDNEEPNRSETRTTRGDRLETGPTYYVCVFVKHTNPCGVGVGHTPIEAYRKAYCGDPNAAMGGSLACSFEITPGFAKSVMGTFDQWGRACGAVGFFVENWIATDFPLEVREVVEGSKEWGKRVRFYVHRAQQHFHSYSREFRSILGGMLVQTPDTIGLNESDWKYVTRRKPTESELSDLRLAWLIAKHTKSNAISLCKDGMLIGNGAGQMSRVMSCRIATWLANENGHADKLKGSVAASDGFFPFDDGPKLLMDAGVTAIIQPGGSRRDEEVIRACDERDVAMIFTGVRHFKH